LLDLTFEAAKCVFQRFAILQLYFCQLKLHLPTRPKIFPLAARKVLISYVVGG
jgi:hypothetical protein